jgi:hypothetical protein
MPPLVRGYGFLSLTLIKTHLKKKTIFEKYEHGNYYSITPQTKKLIKRACMKIFYRILYLENGNYSGS